MSSSWAKELRKEKPTGMCKHSLPAVFATATWFHTARNSVHLQKYLPNESSLGRASCSWFNQNKRLSLFSQIHGVFHKNISYADIRAMSMHLIIISPIIILKRVRESEKRCMIQTDFKKKKPKYNRSKIQYTFFILLLFYRLSCHFTLSHSHAHTYISMSHCSLIHLINNPQTSCMLTMINFFPRYNNLFKVSLVSPKIMSTICLEITQVNGIKSSLWLQKSEEVSKEIHLREKYSITLQMLGGWKAWCLWQRFPAEKNVECYISIPPVPCVLLSALLLVQIFSFKLIRLFLSFPTTLTPVLEEIKALEFTTDKTLNILSMDLRIITLRTLHLPLQGYKAQDWKFQDLHAWFHVNIHVHRSKKVTLEPTKICQCL